MCLEANTPDQTEPASRLSSQYKRKPFLDSEKILDRTAESLCHLELWGFLSEVKLGHQFVWLVDANVTSFDEKWVKWTWTVQQECVNSSHHLGSGCSASNNTNTDFCCSQNTPSVCSQLSQWGESCQIIQVFGTLVSVHLSPEFGVFFSPTVGMLPLLIHKESRPNPKVRSSLLWDFKLHLFCIHTVGDQFSSTVCQSTGLKVDHKLISFSVSPPTTAAEQQSRRGWRRRAWRWRRVSADSRTSTGLCSYPEPADLRGNGSKKRQRKWREAGKKGRLEKGEHLSCW